MPYSYIITSASLLKQDYQNYHADFLLNVSSFYHADHSVLSRWNVSPYIGGGIIHNATMEKTLFGLSYGILGSYRICERLHLNMDLGGTTTFQDFDGIGKKNHIGDNLLQGSIGITVSMGRLGWKKKPKGAASLLSYPSSTNAELSSPHNDYSGLNSLRKRMADGVGDDKNAAQTPDGSIKLDAPILFFFKINSTTLIDSQQKVNIKEIAGAVKEYDLKVKIIGAADSKTGTPKINRELSIKRARYIAKLLNKAGVPKERITTLCGRTGTCVRLHRASKQTEPCTGYGTVHNIFTHQRCYSFADPPCLPSGKRHKGILGDIRHFWSNGTLRLYDKERPDINRQTAVLRTDWTHYSHHRKLLF